MTKIQKIILYTFLGCVIVGIGIPLITCAAIVETTAGKPSREVVFPTVTYEITGSAYQVDITLTNSTGGREQYTNVNLPVRYTCPNFSHWFLYVSAQNQRQAGTVIVSIYIDDELYKTASASGGYAIATASGHR